jgi:hypothetical protein
LDEMTATPAPSYPQRLSFQRWSFRSAAAQKTASGERELVQARLELYSAHVTYTIELEREEDGRWIAEIPALPGVLCYGQDRDEAMAGVQALALPSLPNASRTAKSRRSFSRSRSKPREQLARHQSATGSCGLAANRSGV